MLHASVKQRIRARHGAQLPGRSRLEVSPSDACPLEPAVHVGQVDHPVGPQAMKSPVEGFP